MAKVSSGLNQGCFCLLDFFIGCIQLLLQTFKRVGRDSCEILEKLR